MSVDRSRAFRAQVVIFASGMVVGALLIGALLALPAVYGVNRYMTADAEEAARKQALDKAVATARMGVKNELGVAHENALQRLRAQLDQARAMEVNELNVQLAKVRAQAENDRELAEKTIAAVMAARKPAYPPPSTGPPVPSG